MIVKTAPVIACCSPRAIAEASFTGLSLRAGVRLTRDHSVRFPHAAGKCGNFLTHVNAESLSDVLEY